MIKKEIRSQYKLKRAALTKEERRAKEARIEFLFNSITLPPIQIVHRYLAVEAQQELSVESIIESLSMKFPDIRQVVPVMQKDDMISVCYQKNMLLQPNKWGIPEPIGEIPIADEQIDCILVPLLAFDRNGNRVGYGKGCYDRLLARCRKDIIKLGFSFFEPVESIDDTDKFDIPLNFCITPDRIYEFG